MFGMAFGLGLGTVAGLSVGPYLFDRVKPKDFSFLDESADHVEEIAAPEHGSLVTSEMRSLLEYTEPWTQAPEYERVAMINRLLKVMWPNITKAILDMVLTGSIMESVIRPQLQQQVFGKFAFIEDIVVGTHSLKDSGLDFAKYVQDKHFSVGDVPPRIGGIKISDTSDDEVILETSFIWGSNCQFDVAAFLRFGPLRLFVPVQITNLMIKASARVVVTPLVETIPCLGGVTVTLLNVPHVDLGLKLIKGVDLMALPGMPQLVNFVAGMVLSRLVVYPNTMSFPIMKDFGIAPAPKGAIKVVVMRAEGLSTGSDAYVQVEVRAGRSKQTKTVWNTRAPEFNEEFNLIVDDFEQQTLKVRLYDDDFGANDPEVGNAEVPFGKVVGTKDNDKGEPIDDFQLEEFIRNPQGEAILAVKLYKTERKGLLRIGSKAAGAVLSTAKNTTKRILTLGHKGSSHDKAEKEAEVVGTVYLKVSFIPFFQPKFDDEEAEKALRAKQSAKNKNMFPPPQARAITMKVAGTMKGVLTVTLVRCVDLAPEGAKDMATYVKMLLSTDECDEVQTSSVILTEISPRWGDKFDFVMVPAANSELHFEVYSKASLLSNVLHFAKKKDDRDHSLGKLHMPVAEVARNGRIKDTFTLQDTDRGKIELVLQWQTCYVQE